MAESERKINNIMVYNHGKAESILQEKELMDPLIHVLESSDKYHESIVHLLSKNKWEININLFCHADYQIDAYKDRVALQVVAVGKSSGINIDIIHRDLFRLMVLRSKKIIDAAVLVLRDKKSGDLNYQKAVSELKAYGKAVSVPILVFGI